MRAFRASQYGTHQAPIAEGALIWSPSGMTTITATLHASIEDAAQETNAGYTYTRARLTVDHEYRRNVLLTGSSGYSAPTFCKAADSRAGSRWAAASPGW